MAYRDNYVFGVENVVDKTQVEPLLDRVVTTLPDQDE